MALTLLILAGAGCFFCLYLAVVCILAASRENMLPDIEDVEVGDIM